MSTNSITTKRIKDLLFNSFKIGSRITIRVPVSRFIIGRWTVEFSIPLLPDISLTTLSGGLTINGAGCSTSCVIFKSMNSPNHSTAWQFPYKYLSLI